MTLEGVAGVSADEVHLEQLLSMGRGLVEEGVGLVACQKCVHPVLRDYLRSEVSGMRWRVVWSHEDVFRV